MHSPTPSPALSALLFVLLGPHSPAEPLSLAALLFALLRLAVTLWSQLPTTPLQRRAAAVGGGAQGLLFHLLPGAWISVRPGAPVPLHVALDALAYLSAEVQARHLAYPASVPGWNGFWADLCGLRADLAVHLLAEQQRAS